MENSYTFHKRDWKRKDKDGAAASWWPRNFPLCIKCNKITKPQMSSEASINRSKTSQNLSPSITYRVYQALPWVVELIRHLSIRGERLAHTDKNRCRQRFFSFTTLYHQTELSGPNCSATKFLISSSSSICFKLDEFSCLIIFVFAQ